MNYFCLIRICLKGVGVLISFTLIQKGAIFQVLHSKGENAFLFFCDSSFIEYCVYWLGRLYGRAKRRPVNLTTKQSSELNSVGPETPKSMKFFWFGPLPAMTSSSLIRLQRPLPLSGDVISKNENRTL